MEDYEFDLAIIGAGPGGYVAAIRAAQLGAKVALIEKDRVGGTCLNRGCIPTKAVLQTVEVHRIIERAPAWGVKAELKGIELANVRRFRDETVRRMVKGVETLLKGHKVTLYRGLGAFLDLHTLRVTGEEGETTLRAKRFIIATGSEPARPPIPGLDLPGVVDSDEIMGLESVPATLVIVGAGVIGMELATVFNGLGSQVTVLEMLPRILPPADGPIATRFLGLAKRQGIKVMTSVRVESIEPEGEKLKVNYTHIGKEAPSTCAIADKVLIAVGRRPYTAGLNLEDIGVKTERGAIIVDEALCTSVPHIYAIGDCIGKAMLAHKASYEGEIAAENALGKSRRVDYTALPYCIYTHPEIAGVGLTEE
ncbi:MAG TPA: NAD(P)/FAD-dependent oxidoreductase, partial [Chloroflexi bacterium]|nr:NAD(P)/FAD-dependent oxidoreductase [Chloroflexota bacterium]